MRILCLCGIAVCALSLGCGAKTGLSADEEDAGGPAVFDADRPDAVPPRPDAGQPLGGCGTGDGPTVLFEDPQLRPSELLVRGDTLFFAAIHDNPGLTEAPRGELFAIPTSGGTAEVVPTTASSFSGDFAISETHLVYHRADTSGGPGSWTSSYPDLVVQDLSTGEETLLPDGGDRWAGTSAFALGESGHVYFVDRRDEPPTVWSFSTDLGLQFMRAEDVRQFLIDDGFLFWHSYDRRGNVAYVSEIVGETLSEPLRLAETGGTACCALLGVDEDRLFFYRDGAQRIEAVSRSGGEPQIVADDVNLFIAYAVDSEFIYWGDSADLMYVPKSGGPPRILVDGDTEYVERIATDERCVYWSAVNPPRILALPRP